MHLLYLSYPGGGLETNVRVLAPALEAAGHRVSILSQESGASSETPNQASSRTYSYRCGDVHYYFHRSTFGLGSLSRVVRSVEDTRAVARKVRWIHARDPLDLIELPESFACRRWFQGIPFVVRLHCAAWTYRTLVEAQSGLADALERRMEAATLAAAAGISSPSRALADYIARSCGIEPERIVRIPYPIDTTKFAPDPRTTKEPMVLFVGRVERRKGAHWLLRALPEVRLRHPGTRFAFVGKICDDMTEEALSPPEGARFAGPVRREELIDWYRRAALLCVPSQWDNSPNAIYESMACGTPVVATSVGGIPELVDDGVTGFLVPPERPEELARAINELLDNPELLASMGGLAREKAVECFDLRRITRDSLTFYDSVLREARSQPVR